LQAIFSPDDGEKLSREWLVAVGFEDVGLHLGKLLPAVGNGQVVELTITPPDPELDAYLGVPSPCDKTWSWGVEQGNGNGVTTCWDDYVVLTSIFPSTRGDVRRLLAALGCPLQEPA
jgi:hypothetical protein